MTTTKTGLGFESDFSALRVRFNTGHAYRVVCLSVCINASSSIKTTVAPVVFSARGVVLLNQGCLCEQVTLILENK